MVTHCSQRNGNSAIHGSTPVINTHGFCDTTHLSSAPVRKSSTSSTDSFGSDGQLCTEEYCVFSSKKNTNTGSNKSKGGQVMAGAKSSSTVLRNRGCANLQNSGGKTQNSAPSSKVQIPRKLCKSCGGEMQKIRSPESVDGHVFGRFRRTLKQSLAKFAPKWFYEPEYMVHPKPRDKSDDLK